MKQSCIYVLLYVGHYMLTTVNYMLKIMLVQFEIIVYYENYIHL